MRRAPPSGNQRQLILICAIEEEITMISDYLNDTCRPEQNQYIGPMSSIMTLPHCGFNDIKANLRFFALKKLQRLEAEPQNVRIETIMVDLELAQTKFIDVCPCAEVEPHTYPTLGYETV